MTQCYVNWDTYKKNIWNGFSQLQQNEEFVDMTLAAEGHLVKAHKNLIALASPYIKEMIQSAPCQHPVLFLNNVSHEILKYILEYIYTGEVYVPKTNIEIFINTANALHITGFNDISIPKSLFKTSEDRSYFKARKKVLLKSTIDDETRDVTNSSEITETLLESNDIEIQCLENCTEVTSQYTKEQSANLKENNIDTLNLISNDIKNLRGNIKTEENRTNRNDIITQNFQIKNKYDHRREGSLIENQHENTINCLISTNSQNLEYNVDWISSTKINDKDNAQNEVAIQPLSNNTSTDFDISIQPSTMQVTSMHTNHVRNLPMITINPNLKVSDSIQGPFSSNKRIEICTTSTETQPFEVQMPTNYIAHIQNQSIINTDHEQDIVRTNMTEVGNALLNINKTLPFNLEITSDSNHPNIIINPSAIAKQQQPLSINHRIEVSGDLVDVAAIASQPFEVQHPLGYISQIEDHSMISVKPSSTEQESTGTNKVDLYGPLVDITTHPSEVPTTANYVDNNPKIIINPSTIDHQQESTNNITLATSLTTTPQYVASNRGSLQLILNRYMYYLHHKSNGGKKRRWRCIDYRGKHCKAYLDTYGETITNRKCLHCHPMHDDKIINKFRKNKVFVTMKDADFEHSMKIDLKT